jgi:WD40 repeat protein
MHTNFIYTFIVTKDGKKVITGSKDKKIKVWDWVKQKLIHTLLLHDETVESLVAT